MDPTITSRVSPEEENLPQQNDMVESRHPASLPATSFSCSYTVKKKQQQRRMGAGIRGVINPRKSRKNSTSIDSLTSICSFGDVRTERSSSLWSMQLVAPSGRGGKSLHRLSFSNGSSRSHRTKSMASMSRRDSELSIQAVQVDVGDLGDLGSPFPSTFGSTGSGKTRSRSEDGSVVGEHSPAQPPVEERAMLPSSDSNASSSSLANHATAIPYYRRASCPTLGRVREAESRENLDFAWSITEMVMVEESSMSPAGALQ